ncbi:ArsR/SmtB family transcription factor [Alicyclobacillus hesperidum]|uniref:ArsR/SmtB family transcription factor n=1 Tax=Alicyclobacillus hesperidum TaxID=89784 RepID=UPI00068F87B1
MGQRGRAVVLASQAQLRDVYHAIADPTRRKLLRILADSQEMPLHALTVHFPMGRTAVSKHLAVLKEADLVAERKVGRETLYRLHAEPLKEVQDWISYYQKFWQDRMMALDRLLQEDEP